MSARGVWGRWAWCWVGFALSVGSAACGDGDDTEACVAEPERGEVETGGGTLNYSVVASAISSVTQIVYEGADGPVTVNSPTLPFSVSVVAKAGMDVGIKATGVAPAGGSVTAGYTLASATDPLAASATCQH